MNTNLLSRTIDFLENGDVSNFKDLEPAGIELLLDTGFVEKDGENISFGDHRIINANLLKIFFKLESFFPLASENAPGLHLFGGEISIENTSIGNFCTNESLKSVSGAQLSPGKAIKSCLGEAVERLTQYQLENNSFSLESNNTHKDLKHYFENPLNPDCRYFLGKDCGSLEERLVEEDACVGRSTQAYSDRPPSTGLGAGQTIEHAILHGLLELVERDAFSIWWLGGQWASPVPLSTIAQTGLSNTLNLMRRHVSSRVTWLLDITTFEGLPCIAAVSAAEDGTKVVAGTACHMNLKIAMRNALTEMCMLELAPDIAHMKLENTSGAALNTKDREHLMRSSELNASKCELLHAKGFAKKHPHIAFEDLTVGQQVQQISNTLRESGIDTYFVDITDSEISVPVAKCVSPQLQLYPTNIITTRLTQKVERFGGGNQYHNGIMLY